MGVCGSLGFLSFFHPPRDFSRYLGQVARHTLAMASRVTYIVGHSTIQTVTAEPMPARKPRPPDEKPQFERFLEAAREHGAAETDEGLDEVLRKVIKPKEVTPLAPPSHRNAKRQPS